MRSVGKLVTKIGSAKCKVSKWYWLFSKFFMYNVIFESSEKRYNI